MANQQGKIAYLGLGIMGCAMALNFAKAGYSVTGWNRTPERAGVQLLRAASVTVAESIEEAVRDADFTFSCLGDVPDVEEVLLGSVKQNARKNSVIIDMTTIGQAAARHLSEELEKAGLRFLDAPVTGGDIGARNATLTVLVGGAKDTFDEVLPLFEAIGKNIVYCGEAGCGQAVKLCNQVLCAVNMVAVSETLSLAEAMGIDGNLIVEALSGGAGGSWALANLGPRILKSDLQPGFTIGHMLKDLRLIRENVGDAQLPGTEIAQELFRRAAQDQEDGTRLGTQAMIRAYAGEKESRRP